MSSIGTPPFDGRNWSGLTPTTNRINREFLSFAHAPDHDPLQKSHDFYLIFVWTLLQFFDINPLEI